MNDKQNKTDHLEYWLSKLEPEDRPGIKELWEKTGTTDPADEITVSEDEKSQALAKIKGELKLQAPKRGSDPSKKSEKAYLPNTKWRWIAAAAVVLIAAISYLLVPVKHAAPYGEKAIIELPDQTRVTLNSGSSLSYNRLFGYSHREVHLEGEGYFEVQPEELPFKARTFNATVKVLGTKFNLRSWPGETVSETTVMLTEGKVEFQSLKEPDITVALDPGEMSTLREDVSTPTSPDSASLDETLAWLEDRIMFENRPLYRIIPELERRFNIEIRVNPKQVLRDSLTIYYSGSVEPEQVINDISLSKGLNYRITNNGYVLEN